MTTSPATAGTRITIDIDEETVTGTLTDTFTDYCSQEKIADLPTPLSLEGLARWYDAGPFTIGCYAPRHTLVLVL